MTTKMSYSDWVDAFQPTQNEADESASYDGTMFETYGEDLAHVTTRAPNLVWTLVETDAGGYLIVNGFQRVNRVGYFVTANPFHEAAEYEIEV